MAGVLHGSARAVPRVRAELQASQKAIRVLAAQPRYTTFFSKSLRGP